MYIAPYLLIALCSWKFTNLMFSSLEVKYFDHNFMKLGHIGSYYDVFLKYDNGLYRNMLSGDIVLCSWKFTILMVSGFSKFSKSDIYVLCATSCDKWLHWTFALQLYNICFIVTIHSLMFQQHITIDTCCSNYYKRKVQRKKMKK